MLRRPRLVACLIVGALAVLAAGCGGGGGNQEAEQWASDLCSTVASWKTDIDQISQDAAKAISQAGATKQDLVNAVQDGLDSTKQLVSDLKALPAPDTNGGAEAKDAVNTYVAEVEKAASTVKTTLQGIPDSANVSQVVLSLTSLATTLQATIQSGLELVGQLKSLSGELKSGLQSADSCKDLTKTSS
jgi:hypothetical protein